MEAAHLDQDQLQGSQPVSAVPLEEDFGNTWDALGWTDVPVDVSEVLGLLRVIADTVTDGVVILDAADRVVGFNQAFADLTGYSPDEAPFEPPFPWWPKETDDPAAYQLVANTLRETGSGEDLERDLVIFRRDRRPLVVQSRGAGLVSRDGTVVARLRIVRDLTRDRAALEHRREAAQAAANLATADDLESLLEAAECSFRRLFDGEPTISVRSGESKILFTKGLFRRPREVAVDIRAALKGATSPDTITRRPGILLLPGLPGEWQAKAWVQFPRPRRIGPDELVVADLLAQALSNAVQRLADAERAAGREAQLKEAVASHRVVGQAVGILVERHRILPEDAFDRLRSVSQDRNLRVRELAERILQTGEEPDVV